MGHKELLIETQNALKRASTIADETKAYGSIDAGFESLQNVTAYLKNFDIAGQHYCETCGRKGVSYESAGKVASYLAKILNDTVRLMEFHKGNADSRAETKTPMQDLVKSLTSDQLSTVLKWMDENQSPSIQ